jgi:hypothetical protein
MFHSVFEERWGFAFASASNPPPLHPGRCPPSGVLESGGPLRRTPLTSRMAAPTVVSCNAASLSLPWCCLRSSRAQFGSNITASARVVTPASISLHLGIDRSVTTKRVRRECPVATRLAPAGNTPLHRGEVCPRTQFLPTRQGEVAREVESGCRPR